MVNYQNSIIYKVCCKNTNIKEVYIGSTTNFNRRSQGHKCASKKENTYVYQFIRDNGGWENWDMILIEYYPCHTKRELEKRERQILETYDNNLNSLLPYKTHDEYKALYRHNAKLWYDNHKDTINHKRQLKRKDTTNNAHVCKYCNSNVSHNNSSHHEKTIKHIKNFIQY